MTYPENKEAIEEQFGVHLGLKNYGYQGDLFVDQAKHEIMYQNYSEKLCLEGG